jgi:hypothetical protein
MSPPRLISPPALLRDKHEASTAKHDPKDTSVSNEAHQSSSGFGLQGRRYHSVKTIKWLPMTLLNTQDSDIVIRKRMVQHLLHLRDWQMMRHSKVEKDMEVKLFEILEDVLEMSRCIMGMYR